MNPIKANFEYAVETGNFAARCKEIKISPVKNTSDNLKDKDIIQEIDQFNLDQNNLQKHIEQIKRETK